MKKLFVLLLVLLGVAALAADYMDSFSTYRAQIRRTIGVDIADVTYVSDSSLNDYIREGVVLAGGLTKGEKAIRTVTTHFMRNDYAMDSLITGVMSVVISKNDTVKALLYVPQTLWFQQEHRTTVGQDDPYLRRPSYYDYYDGTILVYPTPTLAGDTIKATCWQKVANISGATSLTSLHPLARVVVLKYATWQAAKAKQHPMTEMFRLEYESSVAVVNSILNAGSNVQNTPVTTPSR